MYIDHAVLYMQKGNGKEKLTINDCMDQEVSCEVGGRVAECKIIKARVISLTYSILRNRRRAGNICCKHFHPQVEQA